MWSEGAGAMTRAQLTWKKIVTATIRLHEFTV